MGYSDEVLADSPGAYWRFNSGAELTDSSGNGNTLTAINTPAEVDGLIASESGGKARDFESADSDAYSAASAASLDVGDVFTLECWLKPESIDTVTNGGMRFICKGAGAYEVSLNTDSKILFTRATVNSVATSTITLSAGVLYHIVVVKNGASGPKIYIDGVDRTDSAGFPVETFTNDNGTLNIGRHQPSGTAHFDGVIDEVAIYPTALSAARIQAHYEAGIGQYAVAVLADSPLGYWRMDELSGLIKDSSGNGRHATAEFGAGSATYSEAGAIATAPGGKSIKLATKEFAIPDEAALDLTATFTIEAWVKRNATGAVHPIMGKGTNGYYTDIHSTGVVRLNKQDILDMAASTGTITNDGLFHHVVVVKDGAADTIVFYIDGVLDSTHTGETTDVDATTQTLRIGSDSNGVTYFDGWLDEVALYSTALSQAQVQAHYNAAQVAVVSRRITNYRHAW